MNEATIHGVEKKILVRHHDERGYFMELARLSDPFFADPGIRQISAPIRLGGSHGVTAWHLHPHQVDWWWVAQGDLQVALLDLREDSPTYLVVNEFLMGEDFDQNFYLKIPCGVAHGFKIRRGPMRLVYFTSMEYSKEEELRLDPRDEQYSRHYDWFKPDPVR